jgi:6-phosphofructokinase 1
MYVPDVFTRPEVREVVPGHLVRSGSTFAYDVNFGKEAGAAAVLLLLQGLSGVTVLSVNGGEIRYISTKEAIRRREVDLRIVSFYEQMDICFGRVPVPCAPLFAEGPGVQDRVY